MQDKCYLIVDISELACHRKKWSLTETPHKTVYTILYLILKHSNKTKEHNCTKYQKKVLF